MPTPKKTTKTRTAARYIPAADLPPGYSWMCSLDQVSPGPGIALLRWRAATHPGARSVPAVYECTICPAASADDAYGLNLLAASFQHASKAMLWWVQDAADRAVTVTNLRPTGNRILLRPNRQACLVVPAAPDASAACSLNFTGWRPLRLVGYFVGADFGGRIIQPGNHTSPPSIPPGSTEA